jgi:hypothetical protein
MSKMRYTFSYKTVILIFTGIIMLLPNITLAQDDPCNDPFNPPANCVPLDTWVWLLVIAGTVLGGVYLHRQQQRNIQRV